jgi:hypothetical protein
MPPETPKTASVCSSKKAAINVTATRGRAAAPDRENSSPARHCGNPIRSQSHRRHAALHSQSSAGQTTGRHPGVSGNDSGCPSGEEYSPAESITLDAKKRGHCAPASVAGKSEGNGSEAESSDDRTVPGLSELVRWRKHGADIPEAASQIAQRIPCYGSRGVGGSRVIVE